MDDCPGEVAASDISGDELVFAEDISELCTIDDDVEFIEYIPVSEQLSELGIVRDDDSDSLGEEESDPIGVDTPSAVIKSEEVSAPGTPEDATPTTEDPAEIPHKNPPKVQPRKISNFSNEQLEVLEELFKQSHYPDHVLKKNLAVRHGLTYTQVCRWFKNKRRRPEKKTKKSGSKKANLGSSKRAKSTLPVNPGTESEEHLAKDQEVRRGGRTPKIVFSREQLVVLERVFKRNTNPDAVIMEDLADRLELSNVKIVKNWFQNTRRRTGRRQSSKSQLPKQTGKQCSVKAKESGDSRKKILNELSKEQLERLEWTFEHNQTPDQTIVEYLAEGLSLTPTRVLDWFGQQRKKVKTNIIETEPQILRESHHSESQLPTQKARAEDRGSMSISPQAGGSSSSPNVEVQSSATHRRYKQKPIDEPSKEPVNSSSPSKHSRGLTKTYPGQTEASRQAESCKVCDRVPRSKKLRNSICDPCDRFIKRYKQLNQTRRRLSVPLCSHKGTQVMDGCRGCRVYRYRQVTMKRKAVSQPKVAQNQTAVLNCKTTSEHENTLVSRRRRSGRLLARDMASVEDFSEFQTETTSYEYPIDLQKKIHVTGKLNKLRRIATTLSNPEEMETKDRLMLSGELEGCVNDLLLLVLGIEPPASKINKNLPSTEEPCPDEQLLPKTTDETSCPSVVRQIQSLEKVVQESITRLEGQIQSSVRKETSTQTDAYLLFSFVSQSDNHDKPPSLSDGQPYYRNYPESIHNFQPPATTQNSPPISTSHCQVCDQGRPQAAVDHNFICTYCQSFMDNLKLLSRANHNLFVPRCAHRGTRVTFGCTDCIVFRYNRVMTGLMPKFTQVELNSGLPKGSCEKNNARLIPESRQSTSGHHTRHSPSYPPPLQRSPNYTQAGNVQPAMSATTQLSLTLSQGGSTSEAIPFQRISSNEKVPESPLGEKTKKCPSVYGLNYNSVRMWCESCLRRKACTRF